MENENTTNNINEIKPKKKYRDGKGYEKVNKKQKSLFLRALKANMGIISAACQTIGLNRRTYYAWYEDDEKFRQSVEEVQEEIIDYVESQLLKQIKDGSAAQTIFFLKTKGKKRGYVESQEWQIKHDEVKIEYILPENIINKELPEINLLENKDYTIINDDEKNNDDINEMEK